MFEKVLDYFIASQSPWAIMFVLSFMFLMFQNTRRERERRDELKEVNDNFKKDLNQILLNTQLMLDTWKLIIQREIERREENK